MLKNLIVKIVSLLLVCVMLGAVVVSCGGDDVDPDNPSNNDPSTPGDVPVEVVDTILEGVDVDMQGYEFNVLCREGPMFMMEATAEDGTGDQVAQAVFNRNKYVEDRFNCLLTNTPQTESNEGTLTSTWNKSVTTGENIYKLGLGHMMYTATECLNGTMLNLTELPYVDLEQPYWHRSMINAAMVNGKLYFTASDYCTSSVYYTYVMIFNMLKCQEIDVDVYGMVDDGTWTIGELQKIVSTCYADDGDNVVEFEDDTFGFVTHYNTALVNWVFAMDIPVTSNPSEGKMEVYFGNDRSIKGAEKLYDLLFESSNGSIIQDEVEPGQTFDPNHPDMKITTKFGNGEAYFTATKIFALENLRSSETTYGIVPYPKFDEEQQEYFSHVDGRASFLFVPYTLPKSEYETVGILLEALTASTTKYVMPVIQDSALLSRYSEDSVAYQMLQKTLDGRAYAFAYFYNSSSNTKPYWVYQSMMNNKNDNLTNAWRSKALTASRDFSTILSKLQKLHKNG